MEGVWDVGRRGSFLGWVRRFLNCTFEDTVGFIKCNFESPDFCIPISQTPRKTKPVARRKPTAQIIERFVLLSWFEGDYITATFKSSHNINLGIRMLKILKLFGANGQYVDVIQTRRKIRLMYVPSKSSGKTYALILLLFLVPPEAMTGTECCEPRERYTRRKRYSGTGGPSLA